MRLSLKILAVLGGKGGASIAADHLALLRAPGAELLLHPSDLVIGAPDPEAARIRTILATELTRTRAYRTYSREANEIEDEIRALWERGDDGALHRRDLSTVSDIEARLAVLPLDFDEWEILHRQLLLVDRRIRSGMIPSPASPSLHHSVVHAGDGPPAAGGSVPRRKAPRGRSARR